jgi:hypothetical protein
MIGKEDSNKQDNLVTVATFTNSIEATLAQQCLEAEGIPAFLQDEATVNVAWHLTIGVGGIKLQVNREQAEQAMLILAEASQADYSALVEEEEEPEENLVSKPSLADRLAERAFRVAVLGIIFLPLQLYSLWLLVKLLVSRRKISSKGQILAWAAMGIDCIVLFVLWEVLKWLKSK